MARKSPVILVSNDDGVSADGIQALAKALSPLGRVVVVAPSSDQSAVSHAMSLRRPLRMTQHPLIETSHGTIEVYGVDGTPTDAVYMAAHHILGKERPDLVVSGINHGANLGNDVLYSGTVSAAMEGVFLGIPSIAVSLVGTHDLNFEHAAQFTKSLCGALLTNPLPKGCLLNVNVPKAISNNKFAVTILGHHVYAPDVIERLDPRGQPYFWIGGGWEGFTDLAGSDCKAIAEGLISVTPIEVKLTANHLLPWVNELKLDVFQAYPAYADIKSL